MTIAECIRLHRQQKNLSQSEPVELLGINNKTLFCYEIDISILPNGALKSIADTITIKDKNLFKHFEVI